MQKGRFTQITVPIKKLVNKALCKIKQLFQWISDNHHDFVLLVLWLYIILNWKKCVSMQFFSQFDGNNILFIVGIIFIVLDFYEIEGKGFNLRKKDAEKMENLLEQADSDYLTRIRSNKASSQKSAEQSKGGQ